MPKPLIIKNEGNGHICAICSLVSLDEFPLVSVSNPKNHALLVMRVCVGCVPSMMGVVVKRFLEGSEKPCG